MQTVDLGDLVVHYEEHGAGRPILMLPGWPSDHRLMRTPLEPRFAAHPGWRRIYPDLPGMGETPGPDSIASQGGMLDAVLRCIEALAPGERFAVAGASYGAYLALGVLRERFDRLDGVMLWTPMMGYPQTEAVPAHHVFQHDPEIDALLEDEEMAWLDISVVHTRRTLEAFRASVKPGLMAADRAFLKRVAAQALPFDPYVIDRPFPGPSLLLAGHQDSTVGYARLVTLLDSFPRATLAVVDRAGHGVAEERRDLFAALFEDWLDRMELEPGADRT